VLGTGQDAGKYQMKITVKDLVAKDEKSTLYDFEVLPAGFGIVQPSTPTVAFVGFDFSVGFSLVGMKRDDKDKLPDVKLTLRVLDGQGKELTAKPYTLDIQALHIPPANDLSTKEVIPIYFPLFLNRTGKYTFHVTAEDLIGKEKREARFSLNVLDPLDFTGK
jgi:hypothetical protein